MYDFPQVEPGAYRELGVCPKSGARHSGGMGRKGTEGHPGSAIRRGRESSLSVPEVWIPEAGLSGRGESGTAERPIEGDECTLVHPGAELWRGE